MRTHRSGRRLPNLRDSPKATAGGAPRGTGVGQHQEDGQGAANPEGYRQDRHRWVHLPPRSDAGAFEVTKAGNVSVMESSVSLPNLSHSLGGPSGALSAYRANDEVRAEGRHSQQRLAGGEAGKCHGILLQATDKARTRHVSVACWCWFRGTSSRQDYSGMHYCSNASTRRQGMVVLVSWSLISATQ